MTKARSQTRDISIKKEEEEEDCKPKLLLNGITTTARNKITKRKPSKNKNINLPVQQVKVEEDTDTKSLLQPTPKPPRLPKGQKISQEQINQLIDYVVNDKMSMMKAARKVKLSLSAAYGYYNLYKNNPDKKIPAPRTQIMYSYRSSTQEHIENLIKYIVDAKMSVPQASAKANMSYDSGRRYYNKYMKDPDHKIPIPYLRHYCTQDQKNEFIGYIVNDKMSIQEASKKAKITLNAGREYYHMYFDDQNPDIPTPSHITCFTHPTQEQIKELIRYIVDDKMTIAAASRKVNIRPKPAGRHYRRYFKENNMELPVLQSGKRFTQDEINRFIRYIVDDKMSITAASEKASMKYTTGYKYYHRYLKENSIRPASSFKYTQDQINKFIGYIADDKMTIKNASKKANISYSTGKKYYMEYRNKHNLDSPALKFRQVKTKEIAGYIIDDKMDMKAASKKANIDHRTGTKYYRQYLKDQKRDASSKSL